MAQPRDDDAAVLVQIQSLAANAVDATYPGHIWADDFVADALVDGTPLRIVTVMDECTREGLAIDVTLIISAERLLQVLTTRVTAHGTPACLWPTDGLPTRSPGARLQCCIPRHESGVDAEWPDKYCQSECGAVSIARSR